MSDLHRPLFALALTLAAAACSDVQGDQIAAIDADRLTNAHSDTANWMSYGRTYREERFSPLKQVNASTIRGLGLAWFHEFDTDRGQEATPIVVDGTLYVTSSWSKVFAFDAKTGTLKWSFDPEVPGKKAADACCDVVNRGVAVWDGKVFVGTLDGRLIALNADNGRPVWSKVTVDQSKPYTITGAPRVVKGKVLIGNGGAELGVRGYISAYDADDGKLAWRFYTVPGNPTKGFEQPELRMAAKTWSGQWWEGGGGGTVWDSMSYDADLDLLYIGVGNGSPWNHMKRSEGKGDNLFTSSIVALRPDTGEYVWHYQTTPGDSWDYTATQHIILADLKIAGRDRRVLMQAPKNGFFYVLDRANGKLISAKNFVPITWASHIDLQTGRPVENPEARYRQGPALVAPSPIGAHNWQPMAYSPDTGLVYIPAQDVPAMFSGAQSFVRSKLGWNTAVDHDVMFGLPSEQTARAALKPMLRGKLIAWDPIRQKQVWSRDLPSYWNGGLLATAGGLVFQGNSSGTLVAYDAATGKTVWEFPVQTGVVAPPITYSIDGEQYIALMAGWGGAGAIALPFSSPVDQSGRLPISGRLLVFKLGGKASLPTPKGADRALPDVAGLSVDEKLSSRGRTIFARYCVVCHGPEAIGNGVIPDLRYSGALANADAWRAVVLDGVLEPRGMVSFAQVINDGEAEALRSYVIQEAKRHVHAQNTGHGSQEKAR